MPVTFNCPRCGRRLLVRDEFGVKVRRCSECGEMVEAPDALSTTPSQASRAEATTLPDAIRTGHLDEAMQFLAERHHAPEQMKIGGGKRWGAFVMSPAEVADFARQYRNTFDMYIEDVSSAHGKGLCVLLYPRGIERGCLRLVGLALVTITADWLHEQGAPSAEGLPMKKSPMDGHPVQLDFIGTVQNEARRPAMAKVSADSISMACRERLYTLGWNQQEIEMIYFGVQAKDTSTAAIVEPEALPSAAAEALGPREMALLQRIYSCTTGARQMNDAMCGVDAVLAAKSPSRVFAAEISDVLAEHKDALLIAVFNGLDMASIPLNDNCRKYFRKPEGTLPTLTGPDSRLITLTFGLAALAESGREAPAQVLARKVVAKFMDKCRRGAAQDRMDEWHIGRWGQIYYMVAGAIMMKEGLEHYVWGLPILDAVAIEYHHAEDPLYWRAVAAYRYWKQKPESSSRVRMAEQRLNAVVSAAKKGHIDPVRLETVRKFLSQMSVKL